MRKNKFFSPARTLVSGFLAIILVGAILLSLPWATRTGERQRVIDALFTATSAVCVTGLVVHNTGDYFSLFGQIVILVLIQIGGFGYMTMATFLLLLIGREISLRHRLIMQESLPQFSLGGVVQFAKYVLKITLVLEGLGAIVLSLRWMTVYPPLKAVYLGIFHSISAFCNAGFSLFQDSLVGFRGDFVTCLTILFLVVLGGLGYVVLSDIYYLRTRKFPHLSLHSRVVLTVTVALVTLGTAFIYIMEFKNPYTLGILGGKEKVLASFFQSVTTRTAGFSVVDVGKMTQGSLFLTIILMVIGASPGGTGGGIKTTTFGVLLASVWATMRGRKDVTIYRHRLPGEVVSKSFIVAFLAIFFVGIITLIIASCEEYEFLRVFFEAVSAFGTVGLSTGITGGLSGIAKFLLILLMFVGRLGPLTIGGAVLQEMEEVRFRYPERSILVG